MNSNSHSSTLKIDTRIECNGSPGRGAVPRLASAALSLLLPLLLLSGCTSTTVDEYNPNPSHLGIGTGEKVVVLGRRQAGRYETEPEFIDCIRKNLTNNPSLTVVEEDYFLDSFYPWFEPRTAPLKLGRMRYMLTEDLIAEKMQALGIRYMIWVDGNTETTDSGGSVSCALSPAGGGCFGFASWEKTSTYEAIIWDLNKLAESGRVMVDAKGESYLLAIGAPIPFIAQVQGDACKGIGNQLRGFFEDSKAARGGNTKP